MKRSYYNEIDPFAAAWLRNLISEGLIADGDVDERSIDDVRPADLDGYTQCHFFAGIGGWSYAMRLAGWPDDRPVWTGSCPCQPFSAAGKGGGFADERHLWPSWFHLISVCRPPVLFGEQVASGPAGLWCDLVQDDLEALEYAFGAVPLPAASVGAPHIRDRLWWVADAKRERVRAFGSSCSGSTSREVQGTLEERQWIWPDVVAVGDDVRNGVMGDTSGQGLALGSLAEVERRDVRDQGPAPRETESLRHHWIRAERLPCRDGKLRPAEPGIFPLLDGIPENLARLRSIENSWLEEVSRHATTCDSDPDEVLRMVRETVCSEPYREEFAIRVRKQLPEASLLLDFLLCVEATRDGAPDRGGFEKAGPEVRERIVRGMRSHEEFGGSSRGWKSEEQSAVQSSDTVFSMSLVLARHASAYREAARKAHAASSRVGLLRSAGNAIVPQVAAEFIRAYSEIGGHP